MSTEEKRIRKQLLGELFTECIQVGGTTHEKYTNFLIALNRKFDECTETPKK